MVESGAAAAARLSNAEIALACASHSGEEKHTSAIAAWLARLGLNESALECGPHAPYAAPCAPPSVLCNNCSGKHSRHAHPGVLFSAPIPPAIPTRAIPRSG